MSDDIEDGAPIPDTVDAEPSPRDALRERINSALRPALEHTASLGTANMGDLRQVVVCIRQAFMELLSEPHQSQLGQPVIKEPVVEEPQLPAEEDLPPPPVDEEPQLPAEEDLPPPVDATDPDQP